MQAPPTPPFDGQIHDQIPHFDVQIPPVVICLNGLDMHWDGEVDTVSDNQQARPPVVAPKLPDVYQTPRILTSG